MITISKELLEKAGYKIYNHNVEFEPHIVRKWQKRFDDEIGTKYFINIDETYGWNPHNDKGEEFHNFWPSVQFDIEVPGYGFNSLNIELVQWFNESGQYSHITIEKMEEIVEEIWSKLKGSYYEKF